MKPEEGDENCKKYKMQQAEYPRKGKVHAIFCNFDAFLGEEGFAPGSQIEAMNLCCRRKKQSFTLLRPSMRLLLLFQCVSFPPCMVGWVWV